MANSSVVLIPCNGLSLRGRLTSRVAALLQEQMGIKIVALSPLMARLPKEVSTIQQASRVIGFAGCSHRCDITGCRMGADQEPNEYFVIGDLVRTEACDINEISESEFQEYILEITSRLAGQISRD
jgi:uncharacterized metal-binding protein